MPLLRPRLPGRLFLLLVAVLATGCDDDDPVGPEPPRDNVISFEVDFDPASGDAILDQTVATIDYDAPEITPAVVEGGFVTAYMFEQDTWTALPFTYGVESPDVPAVDYTVTLGYAYNAGLLQVFYETSLADEELLASLPSRRIRVVVFRDAALRSSSVDLSDYEAVREHFGLER